MVNSWVQGGLNIKYLSDKSSEKRFQKIALFADFSNSVLYCTSISRQLVFTFPQICPSDTTIVCFNLNFLTFIQKNLKKKTTKICTWNEIFLTQKEHTPKAKHENAHSKFTVKINNARVLKRGLTLYFEKIN